METNITEACEKCPVKDVCIQYLLKHPCPIDTENKSQKEDK